jgi:hypothetical protein
MGWIKTIDNENFEFWECDTCSSKEHNYIVVKKGIIEDKRIKCKKCNVMNVQKHSK